MKIPFIIEEYKDNEWWGVSSPTEEKYARAQYETLVDMRKTVRVIKDGVVVWSN